MKFSGVHTFNNLLPATENPRKCSKTQTNLKKHNSAMKLYGFFWEVVIWKSYTKKLPIIGKKNLVFSCQDFHEILGWQFFSNSFGFLPNNVLLKNPLNVLSKTIFFYVFPGDKAFFNKLKEIEFQRNSGVLWRPLCFLKSFSTKTLYFCIFFQENP